MTIPRLELRAALMAAKMLQSLASDLNVPIECCHAWTDAKIVLGWLRSNDPIGNMLIDNYVQQIQELLPSSTWRYVPTETNPADIASRGSDAAKLSKLSTWMEGPQWLAESTSSWPPNLPTTLKPSLCPEDKVISCHVHITDFNILKKFSNLNRMVHFIVRLRRWLKKKFKKSLETPILATIGTLEANAAFLECVKLSQELHFSAEIAELKKGHRIQKSSKLKNLDVFLDKQGIIRIGGRLQNSQMNFEQKHPVVISGKCNLAKLIVNWAHERALHGGFRVTYCHVISRAWIIGGKRMVRDYLRSCMICSRTMSRPMNQAMAPLPSARVQPSRAFSRTGTDYAGPFQILSAKGRGIRSTKGYVAVFVCMSTKAIHLELVGDLTTTSFLGALTRFCSRRGKPSEIWSDNATTFHGADIELKRTLIEANIQWESITEKLADQGIKWNFIPPAAPHFGGLWEAGVKSMKVHLKRIAGPRKLTYEEMSTLLASIEMVLNSRPITPITGEPDDLEILTPGHFLIGASFTSPPKPCMHENNNIDKLTHWNLIRGMRDRF